jgi:hypothetical protein
LTEAAKCVKTGFLTQKERSEMYTQLEMDGVGFGHNDVVSKPTPAGKNVFSNNSELQPIGYGLLSNTDSEGNVRVKVAKAMTLRMKLADWIKVPSNTIQRNEEAHLKRIIGLLQKPIPQHFEGAMAIFPDGSEMKLDCHTRCKAWAKNLAPVPDSVNVHVYFVENLEQAEALYRTYDSQQAVETAQDRMTGAYRGFSDKMVSQLADGKVVKALQLVEGAARGVRALGSEYWQKNQYDIVRSWEKELIQVDRILVGKKKISGGYIAAMLLSIRRHGIDNVEYFWQAFLNEKEYPVMSDSGVQKLRTFAVIRVGKDTRGPKEMAYVAGVSLRCLEYHFIGGTFQNYVALKLDDYLHGKKMRLGNKWVGPRT